MKNLFDFATKELSQDAFLRWFFENWNDELIGKHSLGFIHLLTGLSLRKEDIDPEKTRTWSQKSHMDVGFDIFLKDKKTHYLIVVEDKTNTSEHNQLSSYDSTLSKWQKADHHDQIFKVYYKTYPLAPQELERIECTNEQNEKEQRPSWKVIEPEKIKGFFSPLVNENGSDVLHDYAQHVCDLIDQADKSPAGDPKSWSFLQWQVFFQKSVLRYIEEGFDPQKLSYENWVWRGTNLSCVYYFRKDQKQWPLIEFVVRKDTNEIDARLHIRTKVSDADWSWKRPALDSAYWDWFRDFFRDSNCLQPVFKPSNRVKNQQTMASLRHPIRVCEGQLDAGAKSIADIVIMLFKTLSEEKH